jgi:hypothetical protein
MVVYLWHKQERVLFGGVIHSSYLINSKEWLQFWFTVAHPAFFWLDVWDNHLFSHHFPHLFSFVKDHKLTVLQVAQTPNLSDLFHLPLSEEAYQQF